MIESVNPDESLGAPKVSTDLLGTCQIRFCASASGSWASVSQGMLLPAVPKSARHDDPAPLAKASGGCHFEPARIMAWVYDIVISRRTRSGERGVAASQRVGDAHGIVDVRRSHARSPNIAPLHAMRTHAMTQTSSSSQAVPVRI